MNVNAATALDRPISAPPIEGPMRTVAPSQTTDHQQRSPSQGTAPLAIADAARQSLAAKHSLRGKMREAFMKSHHIIFQTQLYKELKEQKLPKEVYLQYLSNQHHVYQAVEDALNALQNEKWLEQLYHQIRPLFLSDKFKLDLESLSQKFALQVPPPSGKAQDYSKLVKELVGDEPKRILALTFLRYSGLLKGFTFENLVKDQLCSYMDPSEVDLYRQAYRFTLPTDRDSYDKKLQELYDLIPLSDTEMEFIVSAVVKFFHLSIEIHKSLFAAVDQK